MGAALTLLEATRARQSSGEAAAVNDAEGTRCLACGASLSPEQSACTACGWSYAAEDDKSLPEAQALRQGEADSKPDGGPTGMDRLRSLQRPLFLLFLLTPVFAGLGLLVLSLGPWLKRHFLPKEAVANRHRHGVHPDQFSRTRCADLLVASQNLG